MNSRKRLCLTLIYVAFKSQTMISNAQEVNALTTAILLTTTDIFPRLELLRLYIYIYMCVFSYLLTNSIYGDREKEKKRQNSEITMYHESLRSRLGETVVG